MNLWNKLINETVPCDSNFGIDTGFIGETIDLDVTNDVTN